MRSRRLNVLVLLHPHWRLLAIAFAAMLVQAAADLLEPWPLKVIFDHVLDSKPTPAWLAAWVPGGADPIAILNAAAFA